MPRAATCNTQSIQRHAYPPSQSTASSSITISCYEDEVPPFVGAELERIYANAYSSLAQLRITGKLQGASTYVVSDGHQLLTLFLFRVENGKLEVLNEVIKISEDEINRFSAYIFSTFKLIHVITFRAIETNQSKINFCHQRFNYLEDTVADLPNSVEAYEAALSRKMRSNMRRHMKMMKEGIPACEFLVFENDAIPDQHVRDIIELNNVRVAGKNQLSTMNEVEIDRIITLAKANGMIGVMVMNGRICAGAITFRAGENYFLRILAHDQAYNKYSLGTVCCYFTIRECIRRKGKEFHFLWGRFDYKQMFLGVMKDLDYIALYRSRVQYLLNADMVIAAWHKSLMRKAMLWLHHARQKNTPASRIALTALNGMRTLRIGKLALLGALRSS